MGDLLRSSGFSALDVQYEPEMWEVDDDVKEDMLESEGIHYNEKLFRLAGYGADGDLLKVHIEDTDFVSHMATKERQAQSGERANALSVGALVSTGGGILLGYRNPHVAQWSGHYGLPAGYVRRECGEPGEDTFYDNLYRELEEELGLLREEIEDLELMGLITATEDPMLLYRCSASTGKDQLEQQGGGVDPQAEEFNSLLPVTRGNRPSDLTPNARVALNHFFGE